MLPQAYAAVAAKLKEGDPRVSDELAALRGAIDKIADIEPLHVAAYVEALGKDFEKPTVKQHLAAIRMLFDWLVTGPVARKLSPRRIGLRLHRSPQPPRIEHPRLSDAPPRKGLKFQIFLARS